jgi:hypothetical protein
VWGQFRPGTQVGNRSFFSQLSDGITSAFSTTGILSQTVGPTVQADETYTLTVDIGHQMNEGFHGSADLLLSDGTEVIATGSPPTPGHWAPFTATFTGSPETAGDHITIQLRATGSNGNFDNVRLMATPVTAAPEPATLGLIVLGLLGGAGAGFAGRKRRN